MEHVSVSMQDRIALVTISRGKVNALDDAVVDQLGDRLRTLEVDAAVDAVVVTGAGKFFSFGFDIPQFLSYSKEEFTSYLENFVDLYTDLFLYPKPVVAALNGHTIAGGCMLAMACDARVMASGRARISLNEITFGATVFAGAVEMLRFTVGSARATRVLYSGAMYSAAEAHEIGLVDRVSDDEGLMIDSMDEANRLAANARPAFASIKRLLREPVIASARARERESIREFVEIWYSDATWANLKEIRIR